MSLVPESAGFGAGGLICEGINIVLKAAERYVAIDKHMGRAAGHSRRRSPQSV